MTQSDFEIIFEDMVRNMKETLLAKGSDYSSDNDRLSNFKKNAALLGLDPIQIWAVYFLKHIDAILTFVRTKSLASEPIESRFLDALNYLMLGHALHLENKQNGN